MAAAAMGAAFVFPSLLSMPHELSVSNSYLRRIVLPKSSVIKSVAPLSSSSSSSPDTLSAESESSTSLADDLFPPANRSVESGGCKACGREEVERGCNGEGRIQGGIATVPGFGWWPIKAYRPCPGFIASGGSYLRQGQTMDDVVSGGSGRGRTRARAISRGKSPPPASSSSSSTQDSYDQGYNSSKKKKGVNRSKKSYFNLLAFSIIICHIPINLLRVFRGGRLSVVSESSTST